MIILVIAGISSVLTGMIMFILKAWKPIDLLGWLCCMVLPLGFIKFELAEALSLPTDMASLFGLLYALLITQWCAAMIYHGNKPSDLQSPEAEERAKKKNSALAKGLIRRFFPERVQTVNTLSIHEMDTELHDDDNPFIELRYAPSSSEKRLQA
jgi:hypothetical protein